MKTRYIPLIAPIVIALAILVALSTPAMAAHMDELETRCWSGNCLNGTKLTNGTVIVLCNMTGLPTVGNWTFTLPSGTVEMAYVHWHRWGACEDNTPTAEFWNGTGAYQNVSLPDQQTALEDRGVWYTDFNPDNGNHHYYWKVNASAGTNTFNATGCYETSGEHCDARWFVAVINNTSEGNRTHTGHWWHNTGYKKTTSAVEQETNYYNASTNPINTSANYTLWTAQTHYGSTTPSIDFNGQSVGNVSSACACHGDGEYAAFSLCKFNVNNTRIQADGDQNVKWKYKNDDYYVNFGTLAEKIPSEKPDLVVEDIIFPEVMNPSTSYTIKAKIKNQGDAGTGGDFHASLYVNDVLNSTKQTVSSLNAGSSVEASFTGVSLSKGCYDFKVVADVDGEITESNENNNATSEWYEVDNVFVVHNNTDLANKADRVASGTYYIENRTITNCAGCGITIENTTSPFVIQNCTVHDCNWKTAAPDPAGIFLHNVTKGTIGNHSTTKNTIENNTNAGIRVKNSTYVNITDNTIQNNTLYGIYAYPEQLPVTSETRDDCKYINVTNNTVTENVEAVDLIAYNCTVKNNTITDNTKFGIYMMGNYSNITYNNVTDNTDYGVKLYNCSDNYVYKNNFTDNNASSSGHQGWDNRLTNYWNTTDAGKNYTGNRWKDWDDNSGFPSTYDIDGGTNKDKRPKGLYDFLTGASEDKWAFRYRATYAELTSGSPIHPNTEFTTAQYVKIKVNDDDRRNDQTDQNNYYAVHRFNFSISEDTNDIEKINVTWNGIGKHDAGWKADGANLYIWNFTSAAYELLQASANTEAEVTLTGEGTSNFNHYINAGNMTIIAIQKDKQVWGNAAHIETDYVRVAVCAAP